MENPAIELSAYAKRHLKKWGYNPDRFLGDCRYIDPTLNPETCLRTYAKAAKTDMGQKPPEGPPIRLFDPETIFGHEPEVFCRQPEDQRREHGGGSPEIGYEDADETRRQPVMVVEFNYAAVDGEFDEGQRLQCVGMTEMLLWLQEPLVTSGISRSVTDNILRYKYHVLLLMLCPMALGNPTASQLAARLGTSRQMLGKIVADFKLRYPQFITGWMKSQEARHLLREAHAGDTD
jgi:hypothetical protein